MATDCCDAFLDRGVAFATRSRYRFPTETQAPPAPGHVRRLDGSATLKPKAPVTKWSTHASRPPASHSFLSGCPGRNSFCRSIRISMHLKYVASPHVTCLLSSCAWNRDAGHESQQRCLRGWKFKGSMDLPAIGRRGRQILREGWSWTRGRSLLTSTMMGLTEKADPARSDGSLNTLFSTLSSEGQSQLHVLSC